MLFADDLVLCENTREQAEEQLELWRKAIENKGMRVSRSKTEYLPPSSCHDSKVKLGGEEINNVTTFKNIWSMFDADGGSMLMTLFSQMSRIIENIPRTQAALGQHIKFILAIGARVGTVTRSTT